jgi:hypothetical protein
MFGEGAIGIAVAQHRLGAVQVSSLYPTRRRPLRSVEPHADCSFDLGLNRHGCAGRFEGLCAGADTHCCGCIRYILFTCAETVCTALLVCFDALPAGLTFRGKCSLALTSVLGRGWTRDVSMEPTPVELAGGACHMVGLAERREAPNEGRMIFGEPKS